MTNAQSTIEFEINSYDEGADTFSCGQTEPSVLEDNFDIDDFALPAEIVGQIFGYDEPHEFIGKTFKIVI